MSISIFTIWTLARLLEVHYIDKINNGDIYLSSPKQICDTTLRSLSHCVSGAEFTPEALNDFEYNGKLAELYSSNTCDQTKQPDGYDEENIPEINIRCCMCEISDDEGCSSFIYDFCRTLFMSPDILYYYLEQVYGKKTNPIIEL